MASKDDGKRRLECPVCFDQFNSTDRLPKGLPCLHNVCLVCVRRLGSTANNQLQCPMCRKTHTVPNDLADLPTNPVIMDLMDEMDSEPSGDLQAEMKKTLLQSVSLVEEHINKMQMRFISTRKQNEALRVSAKQAHDDTTHVFGSVIDQLTHRQNNVLEEIEAIQREASDDLMGKAKADIQEANENLMKGEQLLNQRVIPKTDFQMFQEAVSKINNLTEADDSPPSVQIAFDWKTTLDDADNFGIVSCNNHARPTEVSVPKEQQIAALSDENKHLHGEITQRNDRISQLQNEKAELSEKVHELSRHLSENTIQFTGQKDENRTLRDTITQLKKQISQLEDKNRHGYTSSELTGATGRHSVSTQQKVHLPSVKKGQWCCKRCGKECQSNLQLIIHSATCQQFEET